MHIEVSYDEVEEFKVIIENHDILDNTKKIESTFDIELTNEGNTTVTTDPDAGLATWILGKINNISTTQELTISQTDLPTEYAAISPIKLKVQFNESGKVKDVTAVSATGIAVLNETYVIDVVEDYKIKIIVKNSPRTVIKITNVAYGTNDTPVQSTIKSGATVNTIDYTNLARTNMAIKIESGATVKNQIN